MGNDDDNINDFFYKKNTLPSGMIRTGVSDERILQIASNYDAIGITSIFSQQETQVLHCAKIIKKKFPNKLLFSGVPKNGILEQSINIPTFYDKVYIINPHSAIDKYRF